MFFRENFDADAISEIFRLAYNPVERETRIMMEF